MDKAIVATLGPWLSQAATRILPNTGLAVVQIGAAIREDSERTAVNGDALEMASLGRGLQNARGRIRPGWVEDKHSRLGASA